MFLVMVSIHPQVQRNRNANKENGHVDETNAVRSKVVASIS